MQQRGRSRSRSRAGNRQAEVGRRNRGAKGNQVRGRGRNSRSQARGGGRRGISHSSAIKRAGYFNQQNSQL